MEVRGQKCRLGFRPRYRTRCRTCTEPASRKCRPRTEPGVSPTYRSSNNSKLQEWEDYYNYDRLHGGVDLDGQTPYERLKQKTKARV